jgi:diguanylate cyclase (GGDEF)-like protein
LTIAESAKQREQAYCITFIDMDGLKLINEQMGHDEGDKPLVTCVTLIKQ